MYCARCGVELRKGMEACPLCGLRAYHPDLNEERAPTPYPIFSAPQDKPSFGLLVLLTFFFLIPIVLCLAIDLRIDGLVKWAGYVTAGILSAYTVILLPFWVRKPNPVVFFPIGMTSLLLMLLYICLKTGGSWFLSLAFPVWGGALLIMETLLVLLRYAVKKKRHRTVIILGSGFISIGALCILVEFLIHITFKARMLWWSFIPFSVLLLIGLAMIIIGSNKALRSSLYKRVFI